MHARILEHVGASSRDSLPVSSLAAGAVLLTLVVGVLCCAVADEDSSCGSFFASLKACFGLTREEPPLLGDVPRSDGRALRLRSAPVIVSSPRAQARAKQLAKGGTARRLDFASPCC